MTFPLFELARRLEGRAKEKRAMRKLADLQSDPHLARDIGMPYQPRPLTRIDKW